MIFKHLIGVAGHLNLVLSLMVVALFIKPGITPGNESYQGNPPPPVELVTEGLEPLHSHIAAPLSVGEPLQRLCEVFVRDTLDAINF